MSKPYRLIVNDDSGRGTVGWVAPLNPEQYLDAVLGVQVKDKPVDALFWCGLRNPCGTTRYASRIGELFCSRDTQDISAQEWTTRTILQSLISQGQDPLTLICDRCHELDKDAWLSMRFNDVHHCRTKAHEKGASVSRIYLERPDLRMGPNHGWKREFAERMWDYLKPEVREHVYALLREVYLDYDIDGVELDFMRHPYFFPKSRLDEGRTSLNDFVRDIRYLSDEAAAKKGRPQGLAVRVPSHDAACAEVGLDWRTWIQAGWVDILTASCMMPAEHQADMRPFVEGCRDTHTLLYWCVESTPGFLDFGRDLSVVYGDGAAAPTTEHYRAMALAAYEQGVDGLYFFNLQFAFESGAHPDAAFLNELHDPELLRHRDQTVLVSPRTNGADALYFESVPRMHLPCALNIEEPEHEFPITLGTDLSQAADDRTLLSARLRLCLKGMTALDEIAVFWDGEEVEGAFQPPLTPGAWIMGGYCFWFADLAESGHAPKRGRHALTMCLKRRNPEIQESIVIEIVELAMRFRRQIDAD